MSILNKSHILRLFSTKQLLSPRCHNIFKVRSLWPHRYITATMCAEMINSWTAWLSCQQQKPFIYLFGDKHLIIPLKCLLACVCLQTEVLGRAWVHHRPLWRAQVLGPGLLENLGNHQLPDLLQVPAGWWLISALQTWTSPSQCLEVSPTRLLTP